MKNTLVPVKHDGNYRIFLFRVPETQYVYCGNRVIVETKKGKQYATCVADSFRVSDDELEAVCQMYQTTAKDLRYVIGSIYETLWDIEELEPEPAPEPEYIETRVVVNDGLVTAVFAESKKVNVEVIDLDNNTDDSDEIAYENLMKDIESGKMIKVF